MSPAISENHLAVYVCSRLEAPSHENWPTLRNFDTRSDRQGLMEWEAIQTRVGAASAKA
jgi:hypothetical protein